MKTFRKTVSIILAAVLVLTLAISLGSCSTSLKGTFTTSEDDNVMKTSYIFDGDRVTKSQTLTLSSTTTSGVASEMSGTFDISYKGWNEGYEITFIWDATGKNEGKTEEERTETFSFLKTSSYIKIGDQYLVRDTTASEEDHEGHNH